MEVAELPDLKENSSLYVNLVANLKEGDLRTKIEGMLSNVTGLKAGPVSVSFDSNEENKLFTEVMQECLIQQPLVLLLDEAMEYDPKTLGSLLRICQHMINNKYPLVLLLAGTPNLNRNLAKTKASFIGRASNLHINGRLLQKRRGRRC